MLTALKVKINYTNCFFSDEENAMPVSTPKPDVAKHSVKKKLENLNRTKSIGTCNKLSRLRDCSIIDK